MTGLLAVAMCAAGTVQMEQDTLLAVLPEPVDIAVPTGLHVLHRELSLTPQVDGTRFSAEWTVFLWDDAPRTLTLTSGTTHVSSLRVDGVVPAGGADPQPGALVAGAGLHSLVMTGEIPEGQPLSWLGAPTGTAWVTQPGWGVQASTEPAVQVDDRVVTGAATVSLVRAQPAPVDRGELVTAEVAVGLTLEDDVVRGKATVRARVRRGGIDTLSVRVRDLGDDLVVDGVASWTQQGDVLVLTLPERVTQQATVTLSWSVDAGERVAVPLIEPLGVFRTEAVLQIARPDDIAIEPDLDGWRAVPRSQVPDWGTGLTVGPARASYVAGRAATGHLTLARFEPIAGPPVIVDVADWRMATSEEGRALLRGLLDVRNERASHLRISPPEGFTLVGVQVAGEPALPVRDGTAWLVPLNRSVETVEGLLSFPVELSLLGTGDDWERRASRAFVLPTVDAPVQVSRTTLVLPPLYRDRGEDAEHRVEAFSRGEGITYGFAQGSAGVAVADGLYRDAVASWLVNDFTAAQSQLDELSSIGADNPNIVRLQSNLDVVQGRAEDVDVQLSKRIREQARARSAGQRREYQEVTEKARKAEQRGDYSGSSAYYQAAIDLGQSLSLIEGEELEISASNAELVLELDEVGERRRQLQSASEDAGRWAGIVESDALPWEVSDESPFQVEGAPWFLNDGEGMGISGIGSSGSGRGGAGYGAVSISGTLGGLSTGRSFEGVAISSDQPSQRRGGLFRRNNMGEPQVSAASLSLDVPVAGEVVRFQRLLVPASTPVVLTVDARRSQPRRT